MYWYDTKKTFFRLTDVEILYKQRQKLVRNAGKETFPAGNEVHDEDYAYL
jgi:hypothetical protein